MSPLGVDIDVYGETAAASALRRIGAHAIDMRPAMAVIRELLVKGNAAQFATQGRFLGTPWPGNTPGTLARKQRMGQGSEPMVATGALQTAIEGGPGRRSRVGKASVSVGVAGSFFYSRFHFKGATRSRGGKLPARPPMGISRPQRETALTIMERYLIRGLT